MTDLSDDELLDALGVSVERDAPSSRSAQDERIIAGFEDIQKFVEKHGRNPFHGEDRDIFERLYAVRLDRIRALPAAVQLLLEHDHQGLLAGATATAETPEAELDDDALLAELGVDPNSTNEITELKHVRSTAEKRAAEEIANRTRCDDFDRFKPLFQQVQQDLESAARQTRPFELKSEIEPGRFFIVGGQKAYVAEKGEVFTNDQGRLDARLRVIFDNGTESKMLMRSLQRALHKDEAGRRISEPAAGPLFAGTASDGDIESGTIYVLRSKSDHPTIAANRDVIHKIGVTGGSVESRIAAAKQDATFLLADVELVASYDLYNINRAKLEGVLHKFFGPARLDLQIKDRFGNPVRPQEWYLVPLPAIDEAVKAIQDGTIGTYRYDPREAALARIIA